MAPLVPRSRPLIRIFVSSTFSDLTAERNVLQAEVWPILEAHCRQRGFQFQAIDLRWGVSTEAGLDHRTMRICLEELRRSQDLSPRPNFLILLGDRYGWQPLPEEITPEEFATLEQAANGDPERLRVVRTWYRRDENANPAVYLLRSRFDSPDERDYTRANEWRSTEQALWAVVSRAFPAEQLPGRFQAPQPSSLVRFQTSATEQEIWHGALQVPDARRHVIAFARHIDNLAEFSGVAGLAQFVDVAADGGPDVILSGALSDLKVELSQRLGPDNFPASPDPAHLVRNQRGEIDLQLPADYLAFLRTAIVKRLTEIIDDEIADYERNAGERSPASDMLRNLERERSEQRRFAAERAPQETFVGREPELRAIREYVAGSSQRPFLVTGSSGTGKSALLAYAARAARTSPSAIVIERYLGVTHHSSDLRSLLLSLCLELRSRFPRSEEISVDPRQLEDEVQAQLQFATAEQPIVLFLDALDQLDESDQARALWWLRPTLPNSHVKLVVSCLTNEGDEVSEIEAALRTRQLVHEGTSVTLDSLSPAEARSLWPVWLRAAGRQLTADQQRIVDDLILPAANTACRRPLFLKTAFAEARLWRSFDSPQRTALAETDEALWDQLSQRLSRPEIHGELLVHRVLGYLASARRGLGETEILEVLFADPQMSDQLRANSCLHQHHWENSRRRIPVAVWARLRVDLADHLSERAAPGGMVLTLFHRRMAAWAKARFGAQAGEHRPHARLADYFERATDVDRRIDELPWQLSAAGDRPRLHAALLRQDVFHGLYHRNEQELLGYWRQLRPEFNPEAGYTAAFADWSRRGQDPARPAILAKEVADFMHHAAAFAGEEQFLNEALRRNAGLYGRESPQAAACLSNLGVFLKRTNRHGAAEAPLREALAIERKCYGPDHSRVGDRLNNLAQLLLAVNRRAEAEPLFRDFLRIAETGKDAEKIAVGLNNLAEFLRSTKPTEAEPLLRRSIAMLEHRLGPNHWRVADGLNNLGSLLHTLVSLGKPNPHLAEAERFMRRAVKIDEAYFGREHPTCATDLSNLALLLLETNRAPEAETLYERALRIDEAAYDADHEDIARDLFNLANLYFVTGRPADAEQSMQRATCILVRFSRRNGRPHPRLEYLTRSYLGMLIAMGNSSAAARAILSVRLKAAEADGGL